MELALSLIVFLYHIVLLCCLAFNTTSCFGSVSRGDNIAPPDPFRRVALPQHHQTTLWSGGGLWSMPPGVKSLLGPYMFQPFCNRGIKCALTSFFPSNFSLPSVAYIISLLFFLAYVIGSPGWPLPLFYHQVHRIDCHWPYRYGYCALVRHYLASSVVMCGN
jgi:hypothetical protein